MRMLCVLVVVANVLTCGVAVCDESGSEKGARPGERGFEVLQELPWSAEAYQGEAAALVRAGVVAKYGREEWAAVVLTHEVHHHVGIYSVLGAKMGVRAREILGAPLRRVQVTSETGIKPPLSCVIDGLQVALSSTLAQGLIHVPETKKGEHKVAATFEFEGRRIRLSVKPEVGERIGTFIAETIRAKGNLTPEYFAEVERFSYVVWRDFDRKAIFLEETLAPSASK